MLTKLRVYTCDHSCWHVEPIPSSNNDLVNVGDKYMARAIARSMANLIYESGSDVIVYFADGHEKLDAHEWINLSHSETPVFSNGTALFD